ncbi:Hypothetical protein CINCED_3A006766 [Cinara cedri]|nr:Hypothetical protein CINCED_3A006766 [Cinara cedri]
MGILNKFKFILNFNKQIQFEPLLYYKKLFSTSTISYDSISNQNVKVYKHQHITLISLNRPEEKNILNLATVGDLKKAILNYENDCSSTIAVLYGEGGSFCAGMEPEELVIEQIYHDLLQTHCHKPIIAAVSGFAYDIGFDLCLWCDMRIVEENTIMAINRKSDKSKSNIFLKRLLSTVGYSRTMDLFLTGRDINSKEAFECGLANRIVACGSSVGQAVNMAFNIGKFPQQAIIHERNVIHEIISK